MIRVFILRLMIILLAGSFSLGGAALVAVPPAYACDCKLCAGWVMDCSASCSCISEKEKTTTIKHLEDEFVSHREWMVKIFFQNHILPALMLFAEQMTAMAMHQVAAIGMMLDAKHQLETQRLFQEMTAQAHKDYQPSEGMCTFGTNVRSLAASDRNMDLSATAIANRGLQRELLSGSTMGGAGTGADSLSRISQFRSVYCSKKDNGNGLALLCPDADKYPGRQNKDINFTQTFDSPLTLKLDFTNEGDPDHQKDKGKQVSPDEEDLFALSANLYAHNLPAPIPATQIMDNGAVQDAGALHYMNIRAVAAKRSVARNSFASIAAMKSQGEKEVQPYLYALVKEMGITDEEEIKKYLGERPSYYAQMEILTKKLYQNPMFYTDLYDKPANVARKNVSMQAIELMQRRDMYRSSLRAEAILAVMLETALLEQEDTIFRDIDSLTASGQAITLPSQ
ncbi:MAG: hypothetical protein WC989_06965 [Micavibrio sp.]